MSKNRSAGRALQILPGTIADSHQLDLLSFVSDYALADVSYKEKEARKALVKSHVAKSSYWRSEGSIDRSKTFAHFCLGDSNLFAVEALKQFFTNDKSESGIFYLKAKSGLGKTHLLHAVAHELNLLKKDFYFGSPLKISALIDHFDSFKNYSFLLIDDLEEIENKTDLQKIFCQLFDYAQFGKMKIILTGNKNPKEFNGCDDRFKGKLSIAQSYHISELDSPLIFEIIESKAKTMNLSISEEVKELISKNYEFNVYGIEGFLHKLKNQDGSIKMILDEFKNQNSELDQVEHHELLKKIASFFQISFDDLISPVRKKDFALVRHVAMYMFKEYEGVSIMKISQLFNRDHSTVIYAIRRIKLELNHNAKLRQKLLKFQQAYLES